MQEGAPGSGAVVEAGEDVRALERLEEAAHRSEVARKQFGRLRDVCIAAQQVSLMPSMPSLTCIPRRCLGAGVWPGRTASLWVRELEMPEVLARKEMFELHAQGVQAIYTRIDTSLARLDSHAGRGSPDSRLSSDTSVTGRRTGSIARLSTFARIGSMRREAVADMPFGATLQRLYTIDQDAFFPDLPALVQVGTSPAISLGCSWALHATHTATACAVAGLGRP